MMIEMEEYGDNEQAISYVYDLPWNEFLKAQDEYFKAKGND